MAYDAPGPGSLKRKRRRREDKPAISAKLFLDSNFKGQVGVLSPDLVDDLLAHQDSNAITGSLYAAITPWTPHPSTSDSPWVIIPIRAPSSTEKPLPHSTIRFPASAPATQAFVRTVQTLSPTKTLRQNTAIEVRVDDVVPLSLDTVFISADYEALQRLEEAKKRYGGGHANQPTYVARRGNRSLPDGTGDGSGAEDFDGKVKEIVKAALSDTDLVHVEDLLHLPIAHPITHTTAPPAKILACEPVSQGLVSTTTNIVIVPSSEKRSTTTTTRRRGVLSPRLDEESGEEDTANEAFYSAAEDNSPAKPVVTSKSSTDLSNTDDLFGSSAEESNLSDDSDDMISLAKPGLADIPSGIGSAMTSATPRPFGMRTHGASTPGSVFSNMTSTTVRGSQAVRSKVFRAQGLYERISEELLHPKPAEDEDEEARVYVDATALARLGCFSGDWVKIEPAESHVLPLLSAFSALDKSFGQRWRPAKVYTLPESMSKRPQRYQVNARFGRRDSISSLVTNNANVATIYLSPLLLANLQDPPHISMTPMAVKQKGSLKRPMTPKPESASSNFPPIASEVTLRKIVTPISTERSLNNTLYANLKQHFEDRQRVVKPGDLIAIQVDESLGRSIYEGDVEQDGSSAGAILAQLGPRTSSEENRASVNVAWFLIEDVSTTPPDDLDGPDADIWGNAASIDPSRMTMRQSGDDKRALPPASTNTWQYYLGVRKLQSRASVSSGTTGMPETSQPYVSLLQRRIRELISVSISPRAVHMGMPPLTVLITSTQRNIGKARTVARACADLGIHFFPIDAHDIVSEGGAGADVQAQGLLEARCERGLDCGPEFTTICISHIEVLNADRASASLKSVLESCRVLVATTTDIEKIPDSVRGLFTHELEMTAPDEGEREGILREAVADSGTPLAIDVDLSAIAVKTAALVAGDLVDVVERAIVAKAERIQALARTKADSAAAAIRVKDVQLSGGAGTNSVLPTDFEAAVELARKNFADSIGAPKIPNVQWSDVGGLTNVKDAVIETIQLPLSRPELFAKGLKKRSGILFYGPPGTGKTLLAKAIATEFSLNFFSVKGPELLNMYIGESEANVRRVFQRARDARPCVVFFDELDSVAPKRGNQGDSGGVMDRIVSQLLAELDGMSDGEENGGGVFVIGATNRPDLLDQALLRPGRFDKMLYLGISDTHEKQATILQALTRKFAVDPALSLPRVSEALPFTFTGADLYALCSDAMLKAVTRSAREVDDRVAVINAERTAHGQNKISVAYYFDHFGSAEDTQVVVTEEDFTLARQELVPSVSLDELRHYEQVRNTFEGTTKKEGSNGEPAKALAAAQPDHSAMDVARSKLQEAAARRSGKGKVPYMNGGDRAFRPAQTPGHASDSEDDYVIRTDRLALHDGARMSPTGKGKGKGKAVDSTPPQGEDLYD